MRSTRRAAVHGACLTVVLSAIVAGLLFIVLHALGIDPDSATREDMTSSAQDWLAAVLVAPAIETLMLAGLLHVLKPLRSMLWIALASALAWSVVHALIAWGSIITAWPFFVFSLVYLQRRPLGFRPAFLATTGAHALHNAALLTLATASG